MPNKKSFMQIKIMKNIAVGAIAIILILTALEFPPPIGFETRPQTDVSLFWLAFFLLSLIVEIAAIPMIYKRPAIGGKLGILTATLNILQVIADQAHLMQPETATFGYLVLEDAVVFVSLILGFFSWKIIKASKTNV
jgi:hypothetical protein